MGKIYTLLGIIQFISFLATDKPHFYIAGILAICTGAILLQMEKRDAKD